MKAVMIVAIGLLCLTASAGHAQDSRIWAVFLCIPQIDSCSMVRPELTFGSETGCKQMVIELHVRIGALTEKTYPGSRYECLSRAVAVWQRD